MTWLFASTLFDLISYKQRHTTHTGGNIMTYSYKYILMPPVLCSQQLSLLHLMNNQKVTLQNSTMP